MDVAEGRPARGGWTTAGAGTRRAILLAVMAGVALRLAFGFAYWTGKPLTLDEQEYLLLARNLVSGLGYGYGATDAAERHFERPPAYPVFLAAVFAVAGDTRAGGADRSTPGAVKVAQSLLGGAAIWLLALVTGRAAGSRAAALAAWLAAVYPPLVWTPAYVFSETMYTVLALLTVLWLGQQIDAGGAQRANAAGENGMRPAGRANGAALAAGVAAGAGVLTREAMVFFLVAAVAWLAATRRVQLLVLVIAGAAAILLPWTTRNYVVHGRFVLGAPHGGVTFWTGNNPMARGEGDLAANPEMKRAQVAFEERHRALTTEQRDAAYYREALDFVRAHPFAWLGLEARKLFYTVVPIGPSYRLHSTRYYVASVVPYLALLPFATVGAIRLARGGRAPWALWLMAASSVAVSLVFFPQERFRIPVIDPTLIACAAACVGIETRRAERSGLDRTNTRRWWSP